MLIELIVHAFIFAFIAVVYIRILGHERILNWWFQFGLQYEQKWYWKPIWGCYLCLSGQLAFWSYLLNWIFAETDGKASFFDYVFIFFPKYGFEIYSVFYGVFSIVTAIFASVIIAKIHSIIEKQ